MGLRVQLLYIRTHFRHLRLLKGARSSSTHLISSLLDVLPRATFYRAHIRVGTIEYLLLVVSLLALSASFSASHCLSVRSPQLSSAYGPVRCPRVLSFCTCLAPRVLPLPSQGIVRLTAPYSTNEDAISRQASIAPGSYLPCYHDRHRIRTRPESGYDS